METWEVFQRYSSPLGIDSGAIVSLCRIMKVSDPLKTLDKVLTLLGAMEAK